MRVALVYPPTCDPTAPYLALPTLTAFLRQNGVEVLQIDANVEGFDAVLDPLLEDFDLEEIALAAVRLVHLASGAGEEEGEIPDASVRPDRDKGRPRDRGDRGDRFDRGRERFDRSERPERFDRGDRPERPPLPAGTAKLFVGLGRRDGVRPSDLVWTIANVTGLSGKQIGPIWIADGHSTVGVPERQVDEVIDALRATKVKGRRVNVRRFVDDR